MEEEKKVGRTEESKMETVLPVVGENCLSYETNEEIRMAADPCSPSKEP